MENLIDYSFDNDLSTTEMLRWLPWVGKNYNDNERNLLVVGESHYTDKESSLEKFMENERDNSYTRACIYEAVIDRKDWTNRTYDNIHRALLKTNDFDTEVFWKQICYYNFVQRLMSSNKDRPTSDDFYNSWKTFIEVIKILKPTDCIFIGVEASKSFNQAMEILNMEHSRIKYPSKVGAVWARTSRIMTNANDLKISFIKHTSKYFSWNKWNIFLENEHKDVLPNLKNLIS